MSRRHAWKVTFEYRHYMGRVKGKSGEKVIIFDPTWIVLTVRYSLNEMEDQIKQFVKDMGDEYVGMTKGEYLGLVLTQVGEI